MSILQAYRYVIFGPSSFSSLPHRGQSIATELASTGANVDYIEFPPSMIGSLRQHFDQLFRRHALEHHEDTARHPATLRVLTPPRVSTSVRNSPVPALDCILFRKWFNEVYDAQDWDTTIAWVMMPLWWKWFIDESVFSPRLLVYDVADDLGVFSSSRYSLWRMHRSERLIAAHLDLVTYSAGQMEAEIRNKFPDQVTQLLPNAIGGPFRKLAESEERTATARSAIGFVGIISDRWVDTDLLEKVARAYPERELVIVGPMDTKNAQRFRRYPNVRLKGLLRHEEIAELVTTFMVALIPFRHNTITRVVNPLKLYEYASAGMPIVAMDTEELRQYSSYISLAETHEEFLDLIGQAIAEGDTHRRQERKHFALQNTWNERIQSFERALGYIMSL